MSFNQTFKHYLRFCVKGWSDFYINPVDVRKVLSISHRERLFCLFDRDYKYTMDIGYANPANVSKMVPVFTTRGVGFAPTSQFDMDNVSMMTVRYKTMKDLDEDRSEILRLQKLLEKYDSEENKKFNEFIKSNTQKLF